MAEGYSKATKDVLCRYFMNSACRVGERCPFSHDLRGTQPSMACRYYLKGACSYGERCRFDHIRQERLDNLRKSNPWPIDNKANEKTKLSKSPTTIKPVVLTSSSPTNVGGKSQESSLTRLRIPSTKLCADAPEFVPRQYIAELPNKNQVTPDVSYANVVGDPVTEENNTSKQTTDSSHELCPFFLWTGTCRHGETCPYIHGLACDMCQLACLHPTDEDQRHRHVQECTKIMEEDMEQSFAIARSKEKMCGICMETVWERNAQSQQRFGILPNCSHCFCLECIRTWRQSKQFENKIIRSCPECRVQSDYIIPSRFWVDDKEKEEKQKLLSSYHKALSSKPCKYFKQGEGDCPFGNKCFYLHATPDGTKRDVGPPKRRKRFTAEGEMQLFIDNMVLWEFIEEREHGLDVLRGSIQTLLMDLELDDITNELFHMEDSISETSDM